MDSCHYWEDQHASHGSESINVSFFTHLNAMFNMYVNMLGYFGFDFFSYDNASYDSNECHNYINHP